MNNDPRTLLAAAVQSAKTLKIEDLLPLVSELLDKMHADIEALLPVPEALMAGAKFNEADDVIRRIIAIAPDSYASHEMFISSAFHRRNWEESARRAESAERAFPNDPRPTLRRAWALMARGDYQAADALLQEGQIRFPANSEIAHEFARIPLSEGNLPAALERFRSAVVRFPDDVRSLASATETLRLLGRFAEAEDLLETGRSKFESNFHFRFQSCWNATRLGQWETAFARWDAMLKEHADLVDMAVGEAIALWHLAKLEGDTRAEAAALPAEIARRAGVSRLGGATDESDYRWQDRDLMMKFESLGDNCEFGLVQRHFGAEPISLLRWSSGIPPQNLVDMLRSRFAGVGDPENTVVRLNDGTREYFAADKRYFQMHTFIKENEAGEAELYTKICKRMAYLKAKILADFEVGEKFFVYKPDSVDVTENEAIQIASQMTHAFPMAKLILVRTTNVEQEVGSVARFTGNVIWGFVSRFAVNLDRRFIRHGEWLALCQAADRHFSL